MESNCKKCHAGDHLLPGGCILLPSLWYFLELISDRPCDTTACLGFMDALGLNALGRQGPY